MSEHEEEEQTTEKSNMDQPQEEFIADEARPSVTEKELREKRQTGQPEREQ